MKGNQRANQVIMRNNKDDVDDASERLDAMDEEQSGSKRGKWSKAEKEYADKLIYAFRSGLIHHVKSDGRSLRSFLANRLKCGAMRISKKFVGYEGLGGRFYERPGVTEEAIELCAKELQQFEDTFFADLSALKARSKKRKHPKISSKNNEVKKVELSSEGNPHDNNDRKNDSNSSVYDFDEYIDKIRLEETAFIINTVTTVPSNMNNNFFANEITKDESIIPVLSTSSSKPLKISSSPDENEILYGVSSYVPPVIDTDQPQSLVANNEENTLAPQSP
eukprot:CAMPEP_0182416370 /NCGR_PEP_ID=MMETSP1167-20130531/648_1 /TAXON_ID=2988 /ORGANISM="Mallomonas Sp, Strain CCMP3275" /LENGTH=277 /DNA_ID=CAMNT_0024589069 /DNA_START=46 /DNA_END=879 /DNA_ORIENTATION=+